MFDEEDLLPLSAIEHVVFCERQAALIHLEQQWNENRLTAEGRIRHEKAHEAGRELRGDVLTVRGLRVRSLDLGLAGQADVVEFHRVPGYAPAAGVPVAGTDGRWRPVPVEYKRGRLRHEEGYEVQLCAQAMCLEEMLGVPVETGAMFYGKSQTRMSVVFDHQLREKTRTAAARLHELVRERATPRAAPDARCPSCSMVNRCLPKATARRSVRAYLAQAFADDRSTPP